MTASPKNRQNIAAAGLLFAVLAGLTILLFVAVFQGFDGSLSGDKGIGRFLVMVLGSKFDPRVLTTIVGILGVGSAYVAGGGLRDRWFYLLVCLAAAASLLCLLLMILFASDQVASALYNFAPEQIADAQDFRGAANWTLGATLVWLVGVLALQVGLHSASARGTGDGN